jgi:hypothetical protein
MIKYSSDKQQSTFYIFTTFANVACHVSTPACQRPCESQLGIRKDLFISIVSLSLPIDTWAPHVNSFFNLQPYASVASSSSRRRRLEGAMAQLLIIEGIEETVRFSYNLDVKSVVEMSLQWRTHLSTGSTGRLQSPNRLPAWMGFAACLGTEIAVNQSSSPLAYLFVRIIKLRIPL